MLQCGYGVRDSGRSSILPRGRSQLGTPKLGANLGAYAPSDFRPNNWSITVAPV